MKKKKSTEQTKEVAKEPKKGIVISETEEDIVLGSNTGDPDDFKNEVKKEADKGKFLRVLMPIFVFLLLGALIGYGTWYYQNQSEKEAPKKAEEKIQTPPAVDGTEPTQDTTPDTSTDTTVTPDTPVSSDTTATYTTYTVKEGDTLSTIANANDMTSSELAKYNNISVDSVIHIGQKLKIPSN